MRFIACLFSIIMPALCFAQFNVTGRILDQVDAKPIPSASVFINSTTIGDKTANNGTFILQNLKPGKYQMVVSAIGFDIYKQNLVVNAANLNLPDIKLHPKVVALTEVTIKKAGNLYRDIYYNQFKDEFLGKSDLARDCKIINPEVIDFEYDDSTNTIAASSSGFLEIRNDALGYKIDYLLNDFSVSSKYMLDKDVHYDGTVLFTEMKGTPGQERRWRQRRQETYEGSTVHFLRAAMTDKLEEEGFKVLQLAVYKNPNRPSDSLVMAKIKRFDFARSNLTKDEINFSDSLAFWRKKEKLLKLPKIMQTLMPFQLSKGDIINLAQDGTFALGCNGDQILIQYNKNGRFLETSRLSNLNNLSYVLNKADDNEITLVNFAEPYAFIDHNGGIINPNSLVFKGAWGRNRVADLLPINYEVPVNNADASAASLKKDTILLNNIARLNAYSVSRPFEKVYLHLNKPRYDISDTIWFKAYTVIGEKHQLSALSGVLYAELISPADSVVKRLTLPLIAGTAVGEFALPRSYKPGSYHIRAYTNWMRNFGTEYFYNQKVQIGGMQIPLTPRKQAAAINPDVQFFPEGGDLVNGVRSKVAIKVVNTNGLGQDIKGTIEDNDGNVVADFATQHLGMGVFALTPQSGKSYKAKITAPGETGFTVNMPPAIDAGYTLALDNRPKDSLHVKVAVNEKLFKEKQHSRFYVIAQSGGKVFFSAAGKLESPVFTAAIEKKRFPSGIVQFTLFSDRGEPMNERLAFIQNNDTIRLNLHPAQTSFTTRQPVKINLDAVGNTDIPVVGSFSVAVINESRVGINEDEEGTIVNNLLLTSELKGNIERPNYYFTDINDQTKADLDVLMLTQGYRLFEWKQILSDRAPAVMFQPERSLELAGTLKTPSGKPVPNGKVTLVSTKENFLRDTITDINGDFKFDNLYLSDTSKIILRARKQHNGSNVAIYVKQPEYPGVAKQKEDGTALSPEIVAILQKNELEYRRGQDSLRNGRQLKEVIIKEKRQAKPDEFNRYGTMEEHYIDMKTLKGFSSLESAIDGTQSTLLLPFKGNRAAIDNIKVVVDGLPFHKKDLYAYDPNEIESVAIISGILPTDPPLLVVTTKRYAGTDRTVLKEVKIKAGRIQKAPDLSLSSNLHGGGNADQVIMGDDLGTGCINISDCLIGKINGINFRSNGTPYNTRGLGGNMSVIVDGNVLNGVHLNELVANDIYSIEVLRSGAAKAIYGTSIEAGGALIITMKHGGENNKYNAAADTTILKQVDIKGKKIGKKPALANSANLNGADHANQVIMGDQVQGCIKLSDCLNGKVAGVKFDIDGIPYSTRTGSRLGQASGFGPPPMITIVDGAIMNASFLNQINPNDIYSIEVLRSGAYLAIYGTNAPGGAFVITTKRGGESSFVTSMTPAGLITYPFQGFHKARTFYSPKYTASTSAQTPDMRNTVYWNPNIITDKNGKASFEYFNNDTRGTYRIVVEGIDDNGNLGRTVYRYKVE